MALCPALRHWYRARKNHDDQPRLLRRERVTHRKPRRLHSAQGARCRFLDLHGGATLAFEGGCRSGQRGARKPVGQVRRKNHHGVDSRRLPGRHQQPAAAAVLQLDCSDGRGRRAQHPHRPVRFVGNRDRRLHCDCGRLHRRSIHYSAMARQANQPSPP